LAFQERALECVSPLIKDDIKIEIDISLRYPISVVHVDDEPVAFHLAKPGCIHVHLSSDFEDLFCLIRLHRENDPRLALSEQNRIPPQSTDLQLYHSAQLLFRPGYATLGQRDG
jgi:hypothetical protein